MESSKSTRKFSCASYYTLRFFLILAEDLKAILIDISFMVRYLISCTYLVSDEIESRSRAIGRFR